MSRLVFSVKYYCYQYHYYYWVLCNYGSSHPQIFLVHFHFNLVSLLLAILTARLVTELITMISLQQYFSFGPIKIEKLCTKQVWLHNSFLNYLLSTLLNHIVCPIYQLIISYCVPTFLSFFLSFFWNVCDWLVHFFTWKTKNKNIELYVFPYIPNRNTCKSTRYESMRADLTDTWSKQFWDM